MQNPHILNIVFEMLLLIFNQQTVVTTNNIINIFYLHYFIEINDEYSPIISLQIQNIRE